ncbi:MAG TPA: acetylase, partial [Anaerolineales bacterium]|nr:acetylase [Anaerolineales bacterium]
MTLVPELAQQERLGPTVVIHLGTNGSFTDATFD